MPGPNEFAPWSAGFAAGLRMLPRDPSLAVKRMLLPVSYWRHAEFAFVARALRRLPRGARVLDVGSPKDLAVQLARHRSYEVVSSDIREEEVRTSRQIAMAQRAEGHGPGRVFAKVEDARKLTFADASFDAAFSVSVIEHIPADGDTAAVVELARVVRPGGLVVLTVPYDRRYRETFVDGPVYERDRLGAEKVFFERHYDPVTVRQRLLATPTCVTQEFEVWGERSIRIERILGRSRRLRSVCSPLEPLLSKIFLQRLVRDEQGFPMAAFVVLRRS